MEKEQKEGKVDHNALSSSSNDRLDDVNNNHANVEMAYLLLEECYGGFYYCHNYDNDSNHEGHNNNNNAPETTTREMPSTTATKRMASNNSIQSSSSSSLPPLEHWVNVHIIPTRSRNNNNNNINEQLQQQPINGKDDDTNEVIMVSRKENKIKNNNNNHELLVADSFNPLTTTDGNQRYQNRDDRYTDDDDDYCPRCHVLLQQQQQQHSLVLDFNNIVPFDGTITDMRSINRNTETSRYKCCCFRSSSSSTGRERSHCKQQQQRSDAALLMGLLRACSEHVKIVQCNVLLRKKHDTTDSNSNNNNNIYYGSLLVTVSFPYLNPNNYLDENYRRAIDSFVSSQTRITNKIDENAILLRKKKPLYPALQLLLTLIRSDWDQIETIQHHLLLQNNTMQQRHRYMSEKSQSFFPSTLTLEQMYNRIENTDSIRNTKFLQNCKNQQKQKAVHSKRKGDDKSDNSSLLLSLPLDIIQRNMALYFDARSLHMIRSTCSYFHWSLRAIVPGLKLRLYTHQIDSLYWMRQRETSNIRYESDCFDRNRRYCYLDENENGDTHRAITGGATVRLVARPILLSTKSNTFCIKKDRVIYLDPLTGVEIVQNEINQLKDLRRNVACGGLLCDDPGLGKTITVLALTLQSPQIMDSFKKTKKVASTAVSNDNNAIIMEQSDNDKMFDIYWYDEVVPEFRRPALLKLVNEFHKKIPRNINFPLSEIQSSIGRDNDKSDFSLFCGEIEDTIVECTRDEGVDPSSLQLLWKTMVNDFKENQMRSVRKSFSNTNAKPNSRVAALVEIESRKKLMNSLIPSAGTLIVVPSVLLEHWKTQINQHVDLTFCTDKIPLIFEYQQKDYIMTVKMAKKLCRREKTHTPLVFIDNAGTRPLPPAGFLAMFKIVITTTNRFMNEAKKGSFQESLNRSAGTDHLTSENLEGFEACEILKIYWLRLVVDEGHSMGNGKNNSTIRFASWVKARRRWAMTGTPTKHNSSQLRQMRGLMDFLQHEFFNSRLGGDNIWNLRIVKGWNDGEVASFYRLRNLLRFLMRRHTKFDIVELPPPLFSKSRIDTSYVEANTYNTLVSGVQMNLLLTSMKGKTSGLQDSLLHRTQAKSARLAVQNIRRVCTGWSRVVPTLSFRYYAETVDMAKSFKLTEEAISKIKIFMSRAEQEELSPCSFCGISLSTMLIMSCCGGLICTECMDNSTDSCYLCDDVFDVDELQKFQPGFILDWRSNLDQHKRPKESPEANQSQEQIPDIIIRPQQHRVRTKKFGDGHLCEYDPFAMDGRCIHCLEEHSFCCLLNDRLRCNICYRMSEECPVDESKSFYLTQRLLELHRHHLSDESRLASAERINSTRPLKIIVFSQFRAALNFVGDRLLRKFGTACIAEYFSSHRKKELHKFTYENCCFCLLLSKDGSEGLDLSYVTNIIFLEEVYDKSLQDQVVARAWRMGATGRVAVETLLAKNTIEEVIDEQTEIPISNDEEIYSSTNGDQRRVKSLLQSLRFITDHNARLSPVATGAKEIKEIDNIATKQNGLKRLLPQTTWEETLSSRSKRERRTVRFADSLSA